MGWEMQALTGAGACSLWGAALFGIACAVCVLVRRDYCKGWTSLIDCAAAAGYTVHALAAFGSAQSLPEVLWDGVVIWLALLLSCLADIRPAMIVVTGMLLVPARLCPLPSSEPLTLLRLSSAAGTLSFASLCAAALVSLCRRGEEADLPGLIAGISLGMI